MRVVSASPLPKKHSCEAGDGRAAQAAAFMCNSGCSSAPPPARVQRMRESKKAKPAAACSCMPLHQQAGSATHQDGVVEQQTQLQRLLRPQPAQLARQHAHARRRRGRHHGRRREHARRRARQAGRLKAQRLRVGRAGAAAGLAAAIAGVAVSRSGRAAAGPIACCCQRCQLVLLLLEQLQQSAGRTHQHLQLAAAKFVRDGGRLVVCRVNTLGCSGSSQRLAMLVQRAARTACAVRWW